MRPAALTFLLVACGPAITDRADGPSDETDDTGPSGDTDPTPDTDSDTDVESDDTEPSGDTDETDASPETDDTDPPPAPTFTRVRAEVLLPSCALSSCHGKARGAPGGLRLGNAPGPDHAELVDVPATLAEGEVLVIPGDPDRSYLVRKIEDAADIVGQSMPPGVTLSAEHKQLVRDWIAAGALND